ncbi:MAG: transposase, partial [Deltaproteobacteria bacterium]|nr:transposase [Deltaproteobacteria bacterium]
MGRNRRCFVNNTCLEVSFRAEEGLPLIAAAYMRVILKGIIAKAFELYDITVCHMLVMSNHVHGILVVEDPECVKDFVGYIKRESAHAINRLLGRRKRTIWCEGYAGTVILDAEKAIERIVYLYTNPQEAGLVEKIEDYPNLSTWEYFVSGGGELRARRIPRHSISPLPSKDLSLAEQQQYACELEEQGEEESVMFIDPDAWMRCFPELGESDCESVNRTIVERIRAKELAFSRNRAKPVFGAHALRIERMNKPHVP